MILFSALPLMMVLWELEWCLWIPYLWEVKFMPETILILLRNNLVYEIPFLVFLVVGFLLMKIGKKKINKDTLGIVLVSLSIFPLIFMIWLEFSSSSGNILLFLKFFNIPLAVFLAYITLGMVYISRKPKINQSTETDIDIKV